MTTEDAKGADPQMLGETWEPQYRRMHRSYERLRRAVDEYIDRDPDLHDEDTSRDIVYHFFADAFHLKDHVKNTTGQTDTIRKSVELLFNVRDSPSASVHLAICADIANGFKHLRLDRPRFESPAEITGQRPAVTLPFRLGAAHFTYHFTIEADGVTYSETEVAEGAVAAWDDWLTANGFTLPAR